MEGLSLSEGMPWGDGLPRAQRLTQIFREAGWQGIRLTVLGLTCGIHSNVVEPAFCRDTVTSR